MTKIGRNELCPCGSGEKYKHCCLIRSQGGQGVEEQQPRQISLKTESEKILRAAEQKRQKLYELGVFVLFTDDGGDAWLLEVTDSDAVQLARAGESLGLEINENPETIEINWSHTFTIREKKLYLTGYDDKIEICLERAPTGRIHAAIRRILKKYSPELLSQVHVDTPAV